MHNTAKKCKPSSRFDQVAYAAPLLIWLQVSRFNLHYYMNECQQLAVKGLLKRFVDNHNQEFLETIDYHFDFDQFNSIIDMVKYAPETEWGQLSKIKCAAKRIKTTRDLR